MPVDSLMFMKTYICLGPVTVMNEDECMRKTELLFSEYVK